ncbi:unnamed protein product, partial [Prunus brigantina]
PAKSLGPHLPNPKPHNPTTSIFVTPKFEVEPNPCICQNDNYIMAIIVFLSGYFNNKKQTSIATNAKHTNVNVVTFAVIERTTGSHRRPFTKQI